MENNFDVIIAGCGAAGLYGAINLPSDCRVLLLCKQELTLCNSALAQGGIAGVYKSPEDSIELHEHDTMVAGGFTNNPETVHILRRGLRPDTGRRTAPDAGGRTQPSPDLPS